MLLFLDESLNEGGVEESGVLDGYGVTVEGRRRNHGAQLERLTRRPQANDNELIIIIIITKRRY